MAEDVDYCPLHECVFSGDVRKLSSLLRTNDVSKKDKHVVFIMQRSLVYGSLHSARLFTVAGHDMATYRLRQAAVHGSLVQRNLKIRKHLHRTCSLGLDTGLKSDDDAG
ncbi:unnamed protein product [Timema podura]|uniref:Uncharacterized protein n=1 Tax=Timema podura TaxID=61482 RepID=A0ABN7NQI3_TIMPD|nr:unnamed protein product [Timema podura]